jgi:hypothetical protein
LDRFFSETGPVSPFTRAVQATEFEARLASRRRHQSLLWRCRRLFVSDLRCGGEQREAAVDRLRQRAECVLRRRRLCAHSRRRDAGDDLRRRRTVSLERCDGREGGTCSLVFHVVGMPSYQHQRVHKVTHHTLGDGVFGNFVDLSASAACCHVVISPENWVIEMERVIAEAPRNNQPAYIAVPSDYALSPVVQADVEPIVVHSNEAALQKVMTAIAERIKKAKSIVVLPAFTMLRLGLQKELQKAIEAIGCPFATTLMEKCVIDESHPQFAGMYTGAASAHWKKTRTGRTTILRLGTMPNCPRRSDAQIGLRRE